MKLCTLLPLLILTASPAIAQDTPIIHDGEFEHLRAQFGTAWDAQDVEIDAKLAEIRDANGGQPPNFLYILIDDVSFGQMGDRKMNYVMGIETPNINQLATEGLSLMRMYTEPSCTPTRTAMLTGRHPVRAGVEEVKVALVGEGLPASEVTLPEILKQAGYNTAHVGKWHQGDIEQSYPHNQGFDWAAFPLHQQVQLSLMTPEAMRSNAMLGYVPEGQNNQFLLDARFKPYGLVTGVEAEAGGVAREVDMAAGEVWTQDKYEDMNLRYQQQALEQLQRVAAEDAPFFLQYWPLYPLNFVYPDQAISRNGGFHADKLQLLDGWIGDLLDALEETGEADNTIVVLMADNGLMYHYEGTSGLNQLIYRGGKTQHLEGGVRTDAFIRWPNVIVANSAAGDIFHVSDIYTTMARIAGATDYIPRDRVIDGIDQTALLLNGEGHGRRDYVYVYEGPVLRSVVKQEFKMHLPAPGQPGAGAPTYNIYRDPREQHPLVGYSLWAGASFQDMVKRHQKMIAKYPHSEIGTGLPYEGIENLRPESELARETFMSWQ
ncbi:sulfatase-like hydrolase/transferase [Ruegeria arenilitoris]|uniref:sulfatase-like hydrolase/transferase n=1 Tax=Ruegeria arenilitoris TaxID=1173585 RepID=UPI00147AA54D|nr:sulfatase-like hydrolase/transferase [Ruegeria arenilitoris]